MFGGGGMNPRKMEQMMEQMGIDVDELDATEVIIRQSDGTELVFDDPDVTRMDARDQQTYQIVGEPTEREAAEPAETAESEETAEDAIPQSDVDLVRERTGASEDDARDALEATDGDLAAAIDYLE
ncbi:nascent polypeptide-associated complex protein [Halanaeroarchaeum sulfurireducens]|uniref:Nascent polypeptide-associated complex protein n=1 Tax=Halanaeroarchaeum sulfurireducens TaxID=1604004 RepID=A0A0F7PD21_9EURY|nr:nascent polypeptide-associated complex protein [Halanaeroarchaeum sulfurireducens]AKH97218.1 nascent polypeptide-associated complex protein [Halanaeroarchaeum sulfurireducens]